MKISVPDSIKACSPSQLAKWIFLSNGVRDFSTLSNQLDFQVQVVSIFSEFSKERLCSSHPTDIVRVFEHLISILSVHDIKEPTGVVTIDGKKYIFDKDFNSYNTGAIIDLKLIESVYDDPYKVLSILYIEEGMKYGQLDKNDKPMNPSKDRIKLFKADFPGDEFLNVFGFFLDYYTKRNNAILALNTAKAMILMESEKNRLKKEIKTLNGSFGQRT